MAVTIEDVRHVASLARLGLSDERAVSLVAELNTILAHMDGLSKVDTSGVGDADVGTAGAAAGGPSRPDAGPPIPLAHDRRTFAPRMADGFFLVPRLSTHEESAGS